MNFARIETLYFNYVQIAFDHCNTYIDLEKRLHENNLQCNNCSPNNTICIHEFLKHEIKEKMRNEYFISVIFSALSLEAYIYELGAIYLSDKYVKENLDKLTVPSKYIIVLELISKNQVDKSHQWYYLLNKLISTRNKLVHSKSRKLDVSLMSENPEKFITELNETNKRLISPLDAINAIISVHKYIKLFLPNNIVFLLIDENKYYEMYKQMK